MRLGNFIGGVAVCDALKTQFMVEGREGVVSEEMIVSKIYYLRGQKVMLDQDLAVLYEVETKTLKRQVKRNLDRFPEDFMFELTKEELENLRCQNGTSSWGGARYLPMAFTEQGWLCYRVY